jgi:hypothetical protein
MAFGAAIAGSVANLAGLEAAATAEAVGAAATGVYLFNALPLVVALAVVLRFFRASAQPLPA